MLRLLTLLARSPDGLRADEVAGALGKSASTAYNLLDTLCQEGFVVHGEGAAYTLTAEASALVPGAERRDPLAAGLVGVLDSLFSRTHKRVYLATARRGKVVVPLARGRQGMPRVPGLGVHVGDKAHALALGKVALSLLSEPALERYIAPGLKSFTSTTITSPERLRAQLAEIRAGAIAFDREEFAEGICCLAAPVYNAAGQPVAALGMSMSTRCFELEHEALETTLRDVVAEAVRALQKPGIPAISEDLGVLETHHPTDVRSVTSAARNRVSNREEVAS